MRHVKITLGEASRVVDLAQYAIPQGFSQVVIRGGGWVTGLAAQDGRMYVRTDVGGAYRWDDAPGRWVQMVTAAGVPAPHASDYEVEGLACAPSNPDVVYLSVGSTASFTEPDNITPLNGRVLRSADAGQTWTASGRDWYMAGNGEARQAGARLAVDPTNPDIVYLGTRADGLHLSADGGQTWTELTALPAAVGDESPATPIGITFVMVDPDSPVVSGRHQTLWAGVHGVGLCKTADGGATWATVSAFTGGYIRDMDRAADGTLYVCFYHPTAASSEVRRVDPGGAVTAITPGSSQTWCSIAVDPHDPDRVFVAADGINGTSRFFRTLTGSSATPAWTGLSAAITNGERGTVWPASSDILSYWSVGQFRFVDGALWHAGGMGAWRSTDLGDAEATFEFMSDGIEELVANVAHKPPGKPLLTASWDRGLFRHPAPASRNPGVGKASYLPYRTAFGSAWDIAASPTDPLFIAAILDDSQDLSGTTIPARRASAWSDDGGETWTRFGALTAGTAPADLMFGNIAVSAGDSDNLVWVPSPLTGLASRIYYTADRGDTWTAATLNGLTTSDFLHHRYNFHRQILAAHPNSPGLFYALGGTTAGAAILWKSADGGATWDKVSTTGLRSTESDFSFNTHFVILNTPSGVRFIATGHTPWCRSEDGVTWEVTTTPLVVPVALGVGAPMSNGGNPALYTYGLVAGVRGLHRSTDLGDSWGLLTEGPGGIYRGIRAIAGDPEVAGRVYVGFSGVGYVVGQFS